MCDKVQIKPGVEPLLALYSKVQSECTRYRNFEWQVAPVTIALLAGVIALSRLPDTDPFLTYGMTVFVLIVMLCVTYCYYKVHWDYVHNRNVEIRCQKLLHFYNEQSYGGRLLPEEWTEEEVKFGHGIWHPLGWYVLVWFVAVCALYRVAWTTVLSWWDKIMS